MRRAGDNAGTRGPTQNVGSVPLIVVLGLALGFSNLAPTSAIAAPASDGAIQGPALPSVEDEPGEDPLPDVAPDVDEGEPSASPEPSPEPEPKPVVEPPPPTLEEPEVVRVAVGLSSELDGAKQERALLDQLQRSVASSPAPKAEVRRLPVGAAGAREICRKRRDDLVITIGYMPDRSDPVLLTRDCRIDEALGIRASSAAEDPDLLGVLWAEHNTRVAQGARERRRGRISPKLRTGLIAGAAVTVIAAAVSLLIVGAVRRDSVVLVVSP